MHLTALYTCDGEIVVHRSRCSHDIPPDGAGYPEIREKLHFSASNRTEAMERTWPRSLVVLGRTKIHRELWPDRTQFLSCTEGLPE